LTERDNFAEKKLTYKNLSGGCVNLTSWTTVKQTLKRNSLLFAEREQRWIHRHIFPGHP